MASSLTHTQQDPRGKGHASGHKLMQPRTTKTKAQSHRRTRFRVHQERITSMSSKSQTRIRRILGLKGHKLGGIPKPKKKKNTHTHKKETRHGIECHLYDTPLTRVRFVTQAIGRRGISSPRIPSFTLPRPQSSLVSLVRAQGVPYETRATRGMETETEARQARNTRAKGQGSPAEGRHRPKRTREVDGGLK